MHLCAWRTEDGAVFLFCLVPLRQVFSFSLELECRRGWNTGMLCCGAEDPGYTNFSVVMRIWVQALMLA